MDKVVEEALKDILLENAWVNEIFVGKLLEWSVELEEICFIISYEKTFIGKSVDAIFDKLDILSFLGSILAFLNELGLKVESSFVSELVDVMLEAFDLLVSESSTNEPFDVILDIIDSTPNIEVTSYSVDNNFAEKSCGTRFKKEVNSELGIAMAIILAVLDFNGTIVVDFEFAVYFSYGETVDRRATIIHRL